MFLLAGCTDVDVSFSTEPTIEYGFGVEFSTGEGTNIQYTPGEWLGSAFINEHFGFRMDMSPDEWVVLSDDDLIRFGMDDVDRTRAGFRAIEMSILDVADTGMLLWMVSPLGYPLHTESVALDYLQLVLNVLEQSGEYSNMTVHDAPIQIAGHYWYYFTADIGGARRSVFGRREGDVFGTKRITHIDEGVLWHILDMFSALN